MWERASSFSSTKFKQPSFGTKAVIFLPFLMSCARQHLRMALFGCFASMPTCHARTPDLHPPAPAQELSPEVSDASLNLHIDFGQMVNNNFAWGFGQNNDIT